MTSGPGQTRQPAITTMRRRGCGPRGSCRGATHLGFADIIVVAIVLAILLWASWKQFPAYNRPFTPIPALTPVPRSPRGIRTPAPKAASQR
jgi:hypothetical protein